MKATVLLCILFATACGGRADSATGANSSKLSAGRAAAAGFDPLPTFADATALAAQYTRNPGPQDLIASPGPGYRFFWSWLFRGDNRVVVEVAVNEDGPSVDRVLDPNNPPDEGMPPAQPFFDPMAVTVHPGDITDLAIHAGLGGPIARLDLQEDSEGFNAFYEVTRADGTVYYVDAATGDVTK